MGKISCTHLWLQLDHSTSFIIFNGRDFRIYLIGKCFQKIVYWCQILYRSPPTVACDTFLLLKLVFFNGVYAITSYQISSYQLDPFEPIQLSKEQEFNLSRIKTRYKKIRHLLNLIICVETARNGNCKNWKCILEHLKKLRITVAVLIRLWRKTFS